MKTFFSFIFVLFLFLLDVNRIYAASDASLKCSPATGNYQVGDTFTVDYLMDTRNGEVSGATVVATYDSSLLTAQATESNALLSVTGWSQPLTNALDLALGEITLDFGNSQQSFTGNTSIGQLVLKAKAAGQAQFIFTFFQQYDDTTPGVSKIFGKRDGTNVTNMLTDVNNCIYVVESPNPTTSNIVLSGSPTIYLTPTTSPTSVPVLQELPRTGIVETTVSFLGISAVLLLGGSLPAYISRKRRD